MKALLLFMSFEEFWVGLVHRNRYFAPPNVQVKTLDNPPNKLVNGPYYRDLYCYVFEVFTGIVYWLRGMEHLN